jgi:hypothetical protein
MGYAPQSCAAKNVISSFSHPSRPAKSAGLDQAMFEASAYDAIRGYATLCSDLAGNSPASACEKHWLATLCNLDHLEPDLQASHLTHK